MLMLTLKVSRDLNDSKLALCMIRFITCIIAIASANAYLKKRVKCRL